MFCVYSTNCFFLSISVSVKINVGYMELCTCLPLCVFYRAKRSQSFLSFETQRSRMGWAFSFSPVPVRDSLFLAKESLFF